MRGGLKAFLSILVLSAGLVMGAIVVPTKPALAVCDGCVKAAVIANTAADLVNSTNEQDTILAAILGIGAKALVIPPIPSLPTKIGTQSAGVASVPVNFTPIPYRSLVGYLDTVFLPKLLEINKFQTGNQQQFAAVQGQQQVRVAEATQQIQYKQDVGKMQVTNAAEVLGRADVLCPEPSMGQSDLAAHLMVLQGRAKLEANTAKEGVGSTDTPTYARGPVYAAQQRITARKTTTGDPTGNGGANQNVFSGGSTTIRNADLTSSSLLGNWLLSTDPNIPQSATIAKMYVNQVFPDRAMSNLSANALKKSPLPADVAQVLDEQTSYTAMVNTLRSPFDDEIADRTPVTYDPVTMSPVGGTITALTSLDAAVNRAGYTGDAKAKLISNGQISRSALEYIRYKVYEHDPQTIISDMGGMGSINLGNAVSILATQEIKQVTLLYDIREQIKKTNLLLGTIGSVLLRDRYKEINSRAETLRAVD